MTQKNLVHIRVSDRGWILERLASEITKRLPYVSYDIYANSDAKIQYYMTYGCRDQRVSPIEIALFTHKEKVPAAAAKFEAVAREVDFCIAQSPATEDILRAGRIDKVSTISPGVDLDVFKPRLRIGVVGRTYHTGRKGEAIVADVMDIEGIDWHFTGEGWPGPAQHVDEADLPAFYRSLDYVLVPALIEGGPMCVLEAMASGCKLIAAPVGWVPEFPHTPFELGNSHDLRRVLLEALEEKAALRRSVESYTWDAWAQKHHALFVKLLGFDPLEAMESVNTGETDIRAAVLVHGVEMSGSLGGPSVRAPRTAAALQRIGINADFRADRNFDVQDYDILHVLNVWAPEECETLLRQIEKNNRPAVLSPIFLDLTEHTIYRTAVSQIFGGRKDEAQIRAQFEKLRANLEARKHLPENELEPRAGYFASVRRLVSLADHLILLSEHEKQLLHSIGAHHPSISIVQNPVEAQVFANGDPDLFSNTYGVKDYILCVGRIESRKNQAVLAYALRNTKIPIVFVGHEPDKAYSELVRSLAGHKDVFVGRVEANSAMLASAYAGARVFCLPSWSEGAPLVALEAAAAGCSMVLSNRSSEQEYFGELARYADPANPDELREKILTAYEEDRPTITSAALKELVAQKHSWQTYARNTASAYQTVLGKLNKPDAAPVLIPPQDRTIYLDLTTMAHMKGPPSGIARVEARLSLEMIQQQPAKVRYIIWNSDLRKFLHITLDDVLSGNITNLRSRAGLSKVKSLQDNTPFGEVSFNAQDTVIVFGGAWIRNSLYLNDLVNLKRYLQVSLIPTVYDVIQHKLMHLFPEGVGKAFSDNLSPLVDAADLVLTCSECSKKDLIEYCLEKGVPVPPIGVFHIGDEAVNMHHAEELQADNILPLIHGAKFLLYVSAIDIRKNHKLLLDIWSDISAELGDACPYLVCIGSKGWRHEDVLSQLDHNKSLQKKVLMLHGINDETLNWLYQNCLFTVYPSLYEGWGMPVAESLRHGKFCLSSTGGSLPEVAPDFAEYIDPRDYIGWKRAIVKYVTSSALLSQKEDVVKSYIPSEWSNTAAEVFEAIKIPYHPGRFPLASLGQTITFCSEVEITELPASPFMIGGWGAVEKDGCWTVGSAAILAMSVDNLSSGDVVIKLNAKAFAAETDSVDTIVYVNDVAVTRWEISDALTEYAVKVPKTLLGFDNALRLRLSITNPRSPNMVNDSSDGRMLGLKIASIALVERAVATVPGIWLNNPINLKHGVQIYHSEALRNSRMLGFEINANRSSRVVAFVNGIEVAKLALIADEGLLRCVNLESLGVPLGGNILHLTIESEVNCDISLRRVGLFNQAPAEWVSTLLSVKDEEGTTITRQDQHIAYIGDGIQIAQEQHIVLSANSGTKRAMLGGWYEPDAAFTFFNGNTSTLYLQPPADKATYRLSIAYTVLPPLVGSNYAITVIVGSAPPVKIYAKAQGVNTAILEIPAPLALDLDGRMPVSFICNNALSPNLLGLSIDGRSIGGGIISVGLTEQLPASTSTPFPAANAEGGKFTFSNLPVAPLIEGGWHEIEPDGVWSSGKDSVIILDLSHWKQKAGHIELKLSAFSGEKHKDAVKIDLHVNGVEQPALQLKPGRPVKTTINLASEAVKAHDGIVKLTFKSRSGVCPLEAGYSVDSRMLSFKLHQVKASASPIVSF